MSRIVLYIDDNADNLRLVERLLQRHPGVELRPAMTGQDGLAARPGSCPSRSTSPTSSRSSSATSADPR